jgi:hypothetical protein
MIRESACSRPVVEALKNPSASGERRFFAVVNRANQRHVLETFADGVAQQVAAFLEDFGQGVFEQSLQAAFFGGSDADKAMEKQRPSQMSAG